MVGVCWKKASRASPGKSKNVERGACESLEASEVQNAGGGGGPEPQGRNPSLFALRSSSRHRRGIINKTCANSSTYKALTGKGKKQKELKKQRKDSLIFLSCFPL